MCSLGQKVCKAWLQAEGTPGALCMLSHSADYVVMSIFISKSFEAISTLNGTKNDCRVLCSTQQQQQLLHYDAYIENNSVTHT